MHINHRRGETRTFVFRQDGPMAHRGWYKGRRDSHTTWKALAEERHRAAVRQALHREEEMPVRRKTVRYDAS